MMRYALSKRTWTLVAVSGVLGAGCSLINTFDDVAPQKLVEDAGGDGPSTTDGTTSDGTAQDSPTDTGGDRVDAPSGPRGAIVIGGAAESDAGGTPS